MAGDPLSSDGRPSRLVWVVAAALAVALHAGAAAPFLLGGAPEADDDDLGAPAIEIGMELAAPKQERADLPPGPESDNSAASTASIQQRATPPEKMEAPEEKPVEAESPDRVVTPERIEPPKEVEPQPAKEKTDQSAESTPSEAAAPPSVETAREAPTSVAPTQGTGASASRVRATWQRQLVAHLNRNKRYPGSRTRRDIEIVVRFTIDRTGHLLSAEIAASSGDPAFDEAALAMLRRSDPLPMPPPAVADESLTYSVPVRFVAGGRA